MVIEKGEFDLARMHQVTLSHVRSEEDIQKYSVEGEAELFQEASEWLKAHPRHGLV